MQLTKIKFFRCRYAMPNFKQGFTCQEIHNGRPVCDVLGRNAWSNCFRFGRIDAGRDQRKANVRDDMYRGHFVYGVFTGKCI